MGHPRYSKDEIAERARVIYDQQIRSKVEPDHRGKYLVIDVVTGDYQVGDDEFDLMIRAYEKYPGGTLYVMRIGYPAMGRIGSRIAER